MKRSQIILLSFFLVVTGLIYVSLARNKKEYDKELKTEDKLIYVPVRKVKNTLRMLTLTSYGQITPNSEVIVSVEVQGKLERGDLTMKPGVNFKTGQILYKVNNEEAFYALSSQKSSLANVVIGAMPDIELDFPSEQQKWKQFLNDLHPSKILPALPKISSAKERMFLTSRNILTQYYNLKSQEARMEKYFYAAPFNGTVISIFAEPGAIANPGAQLAKIAKTGEFEVKVPIAMDDIELYKDKSSALFSDPSGKTIAEGKIIRVSNVINQQTQSADVYYSIKPVNEAKIYNGMFVNVDINLPNEKMTMVLPRVAVKDGKVNILEGTKITLKEIVVLDSKPDSMFVIGLKDGQEVLLEQLDAIDQKVTYKGVTR